MSDTAGIAALCITFDMPPYRYSPLPADEIRLLRVVDASDPGDIVCSLQQCSRAETSYTALSYCWGDATPVANVRVEGGTLGVADNLWSFLQQFGNSHRATEMLLWIDAICINQTDADEKSAQVNMMWSLYENAQLVLVWLGVGDSSTESVFSVLEGFAKLDTSAKEEGPDLAIVSVDQLDGRIISKHGSAPGVREQILEDLRTLTHHQYFYRMWTYQELINAPTIEILSGEAHCSWNDLAVLGETLMDTDSWQTDQSFVNLNIARIQEGYQAKDQLVPSNVLSNAINSTMSRDCFDPRDKVFAVLGLPAMRIAAARIGLVADYSLTSNEVFTEVTLLYFNQRLRDVHKAGGKGANTIQHNLCDFVDTLYYSMRLDVVQAKNDLQEWLLPKSRKESDGSFTFMLRPDRHIRCSHGHLLFDFLSDGPAWSAYVAEEETEL